MQLFIDYLPIVIFFASYFYADIYFATGVLMAVMPVFLAVQWVMTRQLNKIYLASTGLVLILGAATLALRNPQFLFWKPTVLNWAIALVFFGSQFIGTKPIAQRMMGSAVELQPAQWRKLNLIWTIFFLLIGALNLYVAYSFSEATWVKFKLFGMLGLTLVFVVVQTIWLTAIMAKEEKTEREGSS